MKKFAADVEPWHTFYTTASSPNPVEIVTRMPVGEKLTFDFSDGPGGIYEIVGTGVAETASHTYGTPVAGTPIRIYDDNNINLLEFFSIDGEQLSGGHPPISGITELYALWIRTNQLSGPIPDIKGCNSLVNLFGKVNNFTSLPTDWSGNQSLKEIWYGETGAGGTIPPFTDLPGLKIINLYDNQLTGFAGGFTPEVDRTQPVTLNLTDNLLTDTAVNLILADAKAVNFKTGDSILLGGTGNAAPTGQGITDKADLITAGCLVTTN